MFGIATLFFLSNHVNKKSESCTIFRRAVAIWGQLSLQGSHSVPLSHCWHGDIHDAWSSIAGLITQPTQKDQKNQQLLPKETQIPLISAVHIQNIRGSAARWIWGKCARLHLPILQWARLGGSLYQFGDATGRAHGSGGTRGMGFKPIRLCPKMVTLIPSVAV